MRDFRLRIKRDDGAELAVCVRMQDTRLVPLSHGCWRELATGRVCDHPPPHPVVSPIWRAWAARWATTHIALTPGPAWIDPPHPIRDDDEDEWRCVAAGLAPHGFVAVHAGVSWPDEVWRALCHRHVVLIPGGASADRVAALVRDLVSCSSRPHRVIRTSSSSPRVHERVTAGAMPHTPVPEPAARVAWARALRYGRREMGARAADLCAALARTQTSASWRKVRRVVATSAPEAAMDAWMALIGWEAQAHIAAIDLERAIALVGGARLVAELLGQDPPASVVAAQRQVNVCVGTSMEDAAAESWTPAGDTPLAELWRSVMAGDRRAGETARARGVVGPWRREADVEQWSDVAELWGTVQEAASDGAVIAAACAWARQRVRAVGVAVVGSGGGRVVGVDGDPAASRLPNAQEVSVRYGGEVIATMRAVGASSSPWAQQALGLAACACAPSVRAHLDALLGGESAAGPVGELIGDSPAMRTVRETILRVASTGFPVLIEGESGVGKELVARAIHRASARRDRRMASVNCAALTDELFEAEVFGHARGAFTGAVGPRVGLFEEAHGGTLFLDEVAELSARAQAKLLRALQEGEVRRLGENQGRAVDVRIVAATNRPLHAAARAGQFREDLVFRLAVVRVQVPPLRDRAEDIPALATAAWSRAVAHRPTRAVLSGEALAALCRYRWPGNVRELQNVMAALVLAAPVRGAVTAGHVAQVIDGDREGDAITLADARRMTEQRVVRRAMVRHAGCRTAAARELGVTRQGLAKLLARLGPDV